MFTAETQSSQSRKQDRKRLFTTKVTKSTKAEYFTQSTQRTLSYKTEHE